jgi:hypothetical protein
MADPFEDFSLLACAPLLRQDAERAEFAGHAISVERDRG